MKEYNMSINLNRSSAVCYISTILVGTGLLIYFAEKGYLPYYKNGEFEFIHIEYKK